MIWSVGAYGGARFPNPSTKVEAVQFVFGFGRPNSYGKSPADRVTLPLHQVEPARVCEPPSAGEKSNASVGTSQELKACQLSQTLTKGHLCLLFRL